MAWQYALLPLNPTKGSSFRISNMGTVGWISSGGVIYNHLSNPDGSLAAYEEIESLDSCGGHSDPSKQYHYHLVMCCIPREYFEKMADETFILKFANRFHTVGKKPIMLPHAKCSDT